VCAPCRSRTLWGSARGLRQGAQGGRLHLTGNPYLFTPRGGTGRAGRVGRVGRHPRTLLCLARLLRGLFACCMTSLNLSLFQQAAMSSHLLLLSLTALVARSLATGVPACTAGSAAPVRCLVGYTYTNVPNMGSSSGTCFCNDANFSVASKGQFVAPSSAACTTTACISSGFTLSTQAAFYNNSAILASWAAGDAYYNNTSRLNNVTSMLFPAGTNCLVSTSVCKGVQVPTSVGNGSSVSMFDCPTSFAGATFTGYEVVGTFANPKNGLAACQAQLANYSATFTWSTGATCNTDNCNTAAILPSSSGSFIKPAAGLVAAAVVAMFI
jgi:hypothetical protein